MNKLQWNLNRNTKRFIQETAIENAVCEMAAMLSMGRCVNSDQVIDVTTVSCIYCIYFGVKPLSQT